MAVVTGDAIGSITQCSDLAQGAHYDVQEGTPDTYWWLLELPSITVIYQHLIDTYIPTKLRIT